MLLFYTIFLDLAMKDRLLMGRCLAFCTYTSLILIFALLEAGFNQFVDSSPLLSQILGDGNKTIQIPTYALDETSGDIEVNGTKTISYAGTETIEFPWRNTTAIIDVNEYVKCIEDQEQAKIAMSRLMGYNMNTPGLTLIDLLPSTLDNCIDTNRPNEERISALIAEAERQ
jgi:hypothetical protein